MIGFGLRALGWLGLGVGAAQAGKSLGEGVKDGAVIAGYGVAAAAIIWGGSKLIKGKKK